jgi:NAD(P)-dependent dehydrogenase (short-subunit alcohol dehydrogenase family)
VHRTQYTVHLTPYTLTTHSLHTHTHPHTHTHTHRTGVTANSICPGFVLTPLIQAQIDLIIEKRGITFKEAAEELVSAKQPSGQFVTAEQVTTYITSITSITSGFLGDFYSSGITRSHDSSFSYSISFPPLLHR